MNHNQIAKASDKLLTNRYKWLVSRLDKITPSISAHDNGTRKIENPHKINKLRKEQDQIFKEMENIEDEFKKRRENTKQ